MEGSLVGFNISFDGFGTTHALCDQAENSH